MVIATLRAKFGEYDSRAGTLETKASPEQEASATQTGASTSELERQSLIELIKNHSVKNPMTLKQFQNCERAGISETLMACIHHLNLDEIGAYLPRAASPAQYIMRWVTDERLGIILSHCPNLETLHLGGQTQISDAGFAKIAALVPQLKVLTLSNHKNITDAGLASLKTLPLRDLYLGGAPEEKSSITDAGLRHIAEIRSLQRFQILDCNGITDTGIGVLCTIPLKNLDLLGCLSLTDASMGSISGVESLESFTMGGRQDGRQPKITKAGLAQLDSHPNLPKLSVYYMPSIDQAARGHLQARGIQLL